MASIFEIIGYVGEVSEPNGPAVKGYFLDDWGRKTQVKFDRWLAQHDKEMYMKFCASIDPIKDTSFLDELPLDEHIRNNL